MLLGPQKKIWICFMNAKVGCIFVRYNGVSFIGENCIKPSVNIMFIPQNGNILDFNFCNFKCIVTSMLQPTIEISSIIITSIVGQISTIEFNLFTMACLLMDKPDNEWIVVHPLIMLHLQCML